MKKAFFNRRMAGGLAALLIATGTFSLLTPPLGSDNLAVNSLFSKNSDSYIVANATPVTENDSITLDNRDLTVSADGTVTDFNPDRFNSLTGDIIKVTFDSSLNIKKINNYVFARKLKSKKVILELSDTFEETGNVAFIDNNIVNITCNDSLKTIGQGAFADNPFLTTVTFGKELEIIDKHAFRGTALSEITITSNVKIIKEEAFCDIRTLKTVDFSNAISLKTIEKSAFKQNEMYWSSSPDTNKPGLSGTLTLPPNLETLEAFAFSYNNIKKVVFPDSIKKIQHAVFKCNMIEDIDFGSFENVDITVNDNVNVPKLEYTGIALPDDIFSYNKLKKINIPDNLVAIGVDAFRENQLEDELIIPANVKYIFACAFSWQNNNNNAGLSLTFKNDNGKDNIEHIAYMAFRKANINNAKTNGTLTIPNSLKSIGDYAFIGNKLKCIDFNGSAPVLDSEVFADNPITSIINLNISNKNAEYPYRFFRNSSTSPLKNVSFNLKNLHSNFNFIPESVFLNGSLRSVNLPSKIDMLYFPTSEYGNAFSRNKGWYDGTRKVALYRINADGITYETNNAIDDSKAKSYVFNPVLLELTFNDKDGNNLFNTLHPKDISIERMNASPIHLDSLATIDYTNFKLGDRLTFTLSDNIPEGYELAPTGIKSLGNNRYELTLDPADSEIVKTIPYDDTDYTLGYKKTTISLRAKTSSGVPSETTPTPGDTPVPGDTAPPDSSVPSETTPTPDDTTVPGETTPPTVTPSVPDVPAVPAPETPTDSETPATPDIPSVNPPVNVPFTPDRIVNPDLIPEGDPLFNIVNEGDTPLGDAEVNKDKGTYTFVDDSDKAPQGIAKIHDDNTLEVVKVFEDKAPKGSLPQTGGSSEAPVVLLGTALLGLGVVFRKKFR